MRRRHVLPVVLSAVLALTGLALTAPPATAVPKVRDPERVSQTQTGWWWLHGVSAQAVADRAAQGHRLIDLEVEKTSPLRLSAVFVKNTGPYQRGWWWYYGLTAKQVGDRLEDKNGRLLDLETYTTGGNRRFAVVMVKNTGAAKKGWWWYYGQTLGQLADKADAKGARVVDTNRYSSGGSSRFAAVLVKNSGVDQSGWWHYYNVTPSTIADRLQQKKARLIDIERVGSNRYDVVMVKRTGEAWWWYYGLTAGGVAERAGQHAARITKLEPYTVDGKKRFAVILVSDTDAETARLRSIMANGLSGGKYGAYLRRVGGPTMVNLNPDYAFETASMIKVAHHLTAHEAWQAGDLAIDDIVPWQARASDPARNPGDTDYNDDKNKCAYNNDGTDASTGASRYRDELGDVLLRQMMVNSDNRTTDAVLNLLGWDAINDVMADLGMTKSSLNHRIGCPRNAPQRGDEWAHNRLTLRDAGRLYTAVADGSALGTGAIQDSFFDLMGGGVPAADSPLGQVIAEEGAKAGLSASEIEQFRTSTEARSKGGSYDSCPDSGPCNPPHWWIRTVGGTVWLPYRTGSAAAGIVPRAHVYGRFADEIPVDCTFTDTACNTTEEADPTDAYDKAGKEIFRKAVATAMTTW